VTPAWAAAKATALHTAWLQVLGSEPPSLSTFLLPLAQAMFETSDGDAWPGAHNWGACDLRALTTQEQAACVAGALKAGDWLHSDGTSGGPHRADDRGILQVDSHPGGTTFRVWFASFPDDVAGAAYFLRIVARSCRALLATADATPAAYAQALYLGCYYEGTHTGARPCGHRTLPLNAGEQGNVDAYTAVVARCSATLATLLEQAPWSLPAPPTPVVDPGGPADEATDPHDAETLPGA
jgi:hypothetical protein